MGFFDVLSTIGDVITAPIQFGASLINRHSQKETNKANERINAANNAFNAEQAELQRKWSADQAQISRDFDTQERLAQQEWQEKITDPSYQLGRWIDAGLSPANFSGDVSPNGVPSGSSVGVPSGQAAQAGSPIAMHAPTMDVLSMSQARLLNAQAQSLEDDNKRRNDMHKYDIKAAGVNISLAEDELNNIRPAQRNKLEKEVQKIGAEIEKIASDIDINKASERLLNAQGELEQKKVDSYAQELQAFLDKNASEIRVNDANVKLMSQNVAESVARIYKMEHEGRLIDAQVKGQIIQNGLSQIEFEVKNRTSWSKIKFENAKNASELRLIPLREYAEGRELKHEGSLNGFMDRTGLTGLQAFTRALGLSFGVSVSKSFK